MRHLPTALLVLLVCSLGLVAAEPNIPADAPLTQRLRPYLQDDYWEMRHQPPALNREDLIRSVEGMRAYFINHQYIAGKFLYAENIRTGELRTQDDNQVRQAGALWGVACLLRDRPNEPTRQTVVVALDYFLNARQTLEDGSFIVVYPGENVLKSGTIALFCLGLTEFLACQDKYLQDEQRVPLRKALDAHLAFLRSLEMTDGSWGNEYDVANSIRSPESSPYFDGEILLAYCRAARLLGYTELLPRIEEALPKLIAKYTVDAWGRGGDLSATKAFAHWGCLAFAECAEAGWGDIELLSAASRALANYTLHENKLLSKTTNSGYAVEGLLGAWRVAMVTGDQEYADMLKRSAMHVLGTLSMMQVGNPHAARNLNFTTLPKVPESSLGGVTAGLDSDLIRIDLVQHQSHATLMALKYFFPEE